MSSAAADPSATVPHSHALRQPELVLKEVRVVNESRFLGQCTIHVAINGEEQPRTFSLLDVTGRKELIWKDQSRPISADASVVVKWTSGKRKKSVQVTFSHDELVNSARKGDRCQRKAEDSTITFIVKLNPLSVDPKKMDDMAKMAEEHKSVLDNLGKVNIALNIALKGTDLVKDAHPALRAALGCITAVHKALGKEQEISERVLALAKDVASVAHVLVDAQRFLTLPGVTRVVDQIQKDMVTARELVEERDDRRGIHKVAEVLFSSDDAEVQKLERSLRDSKTTLNIALSAEMLSAAERNARSEKEDKLVQAIDPGYKVPDERRLRCHPGTREEILSQIHEWTMDFDAQNVLWISAYPGTGKTTIASSVASTLAKENRFSSFFSFNRTTEANPSVLWRMNCAKLARTYQPFLTFLFDKFRDFDFNSATSDEVFDNLILEPLRNWEIPLGSELGFQPPVIVIDALDECPSTEERARAIDSIAKWTELPPLFKLIVTSRPEADIQRKISPISHRALEIYTGDRTSLKTVEDIEKFLASRFDDIRSEYDSLSEGWITKDIIADLSQRAAGVFMWAATVANYISEEPERLSQILEGDLRDGNLFDLYQVLLNTSFPAKSTPQSIVRTFHSIVGAIVVLQKPLTEADLRKLMSGLPATSVDRVLQGLSSVLDGGTHLNFVHQSFVDFLTEHERANIVNDRDERSRIECPERFRICTRDANEMIFETTFAYMVDKLKFNICCFPSSYELNSPTSRARVDDTVEELLRYACQFWGFHLSAWFHKPSPEENAITPVQVSVADFSKKKLLFWIEVLSGTGAYHAAFPALLQLRDCIQSGYVKDSRNRLDVCDEIIVLISDCLQFCRYFGPVLSSSVPHIYLSALPFAPTSSLVAKTYSTDYNNCMKLTQGQISRWPALQIAIRSGNLVTSVAFSPDGKRIASGSDDSTIRMWDAETGQPVGDPFRGHEGLVTSVAFSPDGKRIASGSCDKTIRVWDAETGQPVGEPLRGHEYSVRSVAFSPDSKCIASGSDDSTIRMWDAETGQPVGEPLRGHVHSVLSVAFSPDSKHIASGSGDKTIRVWDAETGEAIGDPFRGHEGSVLSVSFSPDSKRIASGSYDSAIRVWERSAIGVTNSAHQQTQASAAGATVHGSHFPPGFSDQLVIDDGGWVLGDGGLRLFWVPPLQRTGLYRPSNTLVIPPNAVQLDFTDAAWGESWIKCYTGS